MTNAFAELWLVSGTDRLNLLAANTNGGRGVGLVRIVHGMGGETVTEAYQFHITGLTADGAIATQQQLYAYLSKAREYASGDAESEAVYLHARARGEQNARYALVLDFQWDELTDPYHEPFNTLTPTMADITVGLTRTAWMALPPGQHTKIAADNTYQWRKNYQLQTLVTTPAVGAFNGMFKASNGYLYAYSNDGHIYRSTNSGGTWLVWWNGGDGIVQSMAEINSQIWLTITNATSDDGLWASTDLTSTAFTPIESSRGYYDVAVSDGSIWAGANGTLHFRAVSGGAWAQTGGQYDGPVRAMVARSGQRLTDYGQHLTFGDDINVYRTDFGTVYMPDLGPFYQMVDTGDRLVLVGGNGIYVSADGKEWAEVNAGVGATSVGLLANGYLLAGLEDAMLLSRDGGLSWEDAGYTFANDNNDVSGFVEAGGNVYLTHGAKIYSIPDYEDEERGRENRFGDFYGTQRYGVPVANADTQANYDYLLVYNASGPSWTTYTDVASGGVAMLPTPPAAGDIAYFGVSTNSSDASPFYALHIEISTSLKDTNYFLETYNGTSWIAVNMLEDGTRGLVKPGVIAWGVYGSMVATTINSIDAYWVRFRVTTVQASPETPNITNAYIPAKPYAELAGPGGDVPALAHLELRNLHADHYPTHRVYAGLRSVDRGTGFQAYLNMADKQNPAGVTVTMGTDTAFVNSSFSASGRAALYDPTIVDSWETVATIQLSTTTARDFYGTYRVFARGRYVGNTDATRVRLRVVTGSGGYVRTGLPSVMQVSHTQAPTLVELGQFTVSEPRQLLAEEVGDAVSLELQCYATLPGTAGQWTMHDLILVPADEFIGEFGDTSGNGGAGANEFIEIDSTGNPKRSLRALARKRGSNLVKAAWQPNAAGSFAVQPDTTQRLWLLAETYLTPAAHGVPSAYFASEPRVLHEAEIGVNQRYVGLRGRA